MRPTTQPLSDVLARSSSVDEFRAAQSAAIRDDMVKRGRDLATDSTYPPFEVCERVAESCLESQVEVPSRYPFV